MRIISITPKRSISNFGQFCMSCVKVRACESGSTKNINWWVHFDM